MSCNICEDDYGMSFCENDCSYHICSDCCSKMSECPQCNSSLHINWFFAGKMDGNMSKRRIVGHSEDATNLKKATGVNQIVDYKDYIDLSKELAIEEIDSINNITGPCLIMKKVKNPKSIQLKDITNITDIVNTRNKQMIEKCHVFTLEINNQYDCFRSFVEWGIALEMGKVLILEVPVNNKNIKEFYTYASDSIKSFEKISFYKREAILRSHPSLNMNYKEYKKHMEQLISFKKHHLNINDEEEESDDDNNELEIEGDSYDEYGGYWSGHVG